MKSNRRWVATTLLLFTAASVAMLWGLNQLSKSDLRSEVLTRAELRSAQLADAMAGQVVAEFSLMDHALLDMRKEWARDPAAVEAWSTEELRHLPPGLVSHLAIVNAEGRVVYNSLGNNAEVFADDRLHFQLAQTGPDRLIILAPAVSRMTGQ